MTDTEVKSTGMAGVWVLFILLIGGGVFLGYVFWPRQATYTDCNAGGFCVLGNSSAPYDYRWNMSMTSPPSSVWTDQQWQFLSTTVEYQDTFILNLSYYPNIASLPYATINSLDLDLRLYLGDTNVPWDITRVGLNPTGVTPIDNSQSRGKVGSEEVRYTNNLYPSGKTVYALLFVYSGNGSANITMNCDYDLKVVPRADIPVGGFEGWALSNIWLIGGIFVGALVGLTIVMLRVRAKYQRYIEEQKEKTVKEKLGPGVGEPLPGVTILSKPAAAALDDKEKDEKSGKGKKEKKPKK